MLDAVAAILLRETALRVEVQNHSDGVRREVYGRNLTQQRAKSVVNYLIAKGGVEPSRLVAKGYGDSKPIAMPDTDEGRKKNRRTEFLVLDHAPAP